ncbi:MAG: rhomboid family intramembrane serine protease [Myxococcota bacterium]
MLLVPIGHDEGVERRPFLTVALLVVCVAVHIQSVRNSASAEEITEAWDEYVVAVKSATADEVSDEEFLALNDQLLAGELDDDPRFDYALECLDEFQALLRHPWSFDVRAPLSGTLVLYALVHADWMHLIFNMLFLFVAGSSIEDRWGRTFFVGFFAAGAAVSALAYQMLHVDERLALVGASGAVAAMMGSFLVVYWRSRFRMFWFYFIGWKTFRWPAWLYLGLWIGLESYNSWEEGQGLSTGVAHSAHVGGFALGVVVALLLKATGLDRLLLSKDRSATERQEALIRDPSKDALTHARDLAARGEVVKSITRYREAISANPSDNAVRAELARFAIDSNRLAAAHGHLDAMLAEAQRTEGAERVIADWIWLGELSLQDHVTPRGLALVGKASASQGDVNLTTAIIKGLYQRNPKTPQLPGLLWELAELYRRGGNAKSQRQVLATLAKQFPMDPFGERATRNLEANTC